MSIRAKLPLLIGVVIVAVAIALGWTSYLEVRGLALDSAEARLRPSTRQVAAFLSQQHRNMNRVLDSLVADSQLAVALSRNEPPTGPSIDRLERWMEAQSGRIGMELWSQSGARVYAVGDGGQTEGRGPVSASPDPQPAPGITPLKVINDTVFYQVTRPVLEGPDTVGFLTHTQQLEPSEDSRDQFRALTGGDGRLLVGSPASGVWWDQAEVVPGPPSDTRDTGIVTYELDGSDRMALSEPIANSPWVVTMEFVTSTVLADSESFLVRLMLAGGFVTLLGIGGGWLMSRRITVPLNGLTRAVQDFAAGDYTSRVDAGRTDELGAVARAFNAMTARVGEQQAALAQSNETLRENEERLRLVAMGTLDGLWDWHISNGTTFYSPRFRELLENRVSADFLETLRTNVHPADRGATLDAIQDHLEHRAPLDLEARFFLSAGTLRWFRIRGHAMWDDDGRATRLAGSIIEITRQRVAEDEVRKLNAVLEQRVEERTAALTAANQELEAFTYSVSHDLRAPLRQANGFAQLLAEEVGDQLPEDARHYVQRIQDSAMRMSNLVDDLLRLSRVGRQRLEARKVAVNDIVETVRAELSEETLDRSIEWKIGQLPSLACDPTLMRQVFVNLLHNAVKYTRPRTRAVIEVGSSQTTREIVLHVRDNGVGFDPNHADKLFGVFQRLHGPEEFEGTGVGLAIVQRIVRRHGGRVWAESSVDEGATFYIALPIAESGATVGAGAGRS